MPNKNTSIPPTPKPKAFWVIAAAADGALAWKADQLCEDMWALPLGGKWTWIYVARVSEWEYIPSQWQINKIKDSDQYGWFLLQSSAAPVDLLAFGLALAKPQALGESSVCMIHVIGWRCLRSLRRLFICPAGSHEPEVQPAVRRQDKVAGRQLARERS